MALFGGLFWGVFFLVAGVVILLQVTLRWKVVWFRLLFGLFVLLVGVSLLTGNLGWSNLNAAAGNVTVFAADRQIVPESGKENFVVFGAATFDLTDLAPGEHVKINCAFGSCHILLPKGAVDVNTNCAFGIINLPGSQGVILGGGSYRHSGDNPVLVDITCAFGGATVTD